MDSVTVGDKTLISVNRAKEISGYTVDYIGQLCRLGSISCKRVSGQWFIDEDSLRGRSVVQEGKDSNESGEQKKTGTTMGAYMKTIGTVRDDSLTCDGAEYVSSSRAASLTGYAQDYIGELARKGEVEARKMGRQWFVEKASLLAHKAEKDALLASVQSNAAGMVEMATTTAQDNDSEPFRVTYTSETPRTLLGAEASVITHGSRYRAPTEDQSAPARTVQSITSDMLPSIEKVSAGTPSSTEKVPTNPQIPQSRISEIRFRRTEKDYFEEKKEVVAVSAISRPQSSSVKRRPHRVRKYVITAAMLIFVAFVAGVSIQYVMRQGVQLPAIDTTTLQNFIDRYDTVIPGRTVEYIRAN